MRRRTTAAQRRAVRAYWADARHTRLWLWVEYALAILTMTALGVIAETIH